LGQLPPPFLDTTAPPHLLALSAGDREAVLVTLEMGIAVCRGDRGAAETLSASYPTEALACRLDRLCDRVSALGRHRPQTVDIPRLPV
jgi:hypothetical protein